MLQCVADSKAREKLNTVLIRLSRLQCIAVCCNALQCVAMRCRLGSEYILKCTDHRSQSISHNVTVCCVILHLSPEDAGSVLQCVAVCCSALQYVMCVAMCCSVLQRVSACCSVLQGVAVCWGVLQCVAVGSEMPSVGFSPVLQCVAASCSVLRCIAVCCGVL